MATERGWWTLTSTVELDGDDREHIAGLIRDGFTAGEVVNNTDSGELENNTLRWESAGTSEPGDQNADSALVEHGYWSLGPHGRGGWSVELIEQDADLSNIIGGIELGRFETEGEAKAAAQKHENTLAAHRDGDDHA